jgi:hypothetical protein
VSACREAVVREAGRSGQPIFLVSDRAAFYYLATGVPDPTPFDYPMATAFGRQGEARVIEWTATGRIGSVLVDRRIIESALRPARLLAYLQQTRQPDRSGECWDVYRRAVGS